MSNAGFERRRIDVLAVLVGGGVFAVCAAIAHNGRVSGPERAVFEAINGLTSTFEQAGNLVQYLGVLAVGPLVVLIALVLRRWRLAAAAALVTGLKLVIEHGVWKLVPPSPSRTPSCGARRPRVARRSCRATSSCRRVSPGRSRPTCMVGGAPCRGSSWG